MKLLWVSRHYMTEEQLASIKKHFGNIEIVQFEKTVKNIEEIISDDIDVYAVVFPTDKLSELYSKVKGKARIITPVAERIFTGNYITNPSTSFKEKEYAFRHKYWLEYKKIEIKTEILN